MAINAGWLTDFKDIKFAPKTLFSQVYVDNPETGAMTDLNSYFTTFLQKLDARTLQVKLDSDSSVEFKNPEAIGVTGILDVPNGGTGLNAVTQHALLIGNGTNALTLLPSAAGFLVSKQNGTAPLYSGIEGSWANLNSATEGPTFYIYFSGDEITTRYNMGKVPLADAATAGVVSTSAQTFSGGKTFKATAAFEEDVGITGALIVANGASITNGLTVSNGLTINSGYVSGILTPTANGHAANKAYVDAVQLNLDNLSNNIIGGTNTSGQTHHTRLSNLETRMTDAESDFDTLNTYLGGYTDETTKAFFILDKDNQAIAYFDEKGLTVTEVILDGSQNKYKNISLSSYFEKVDQLEVDRGTIYNILGETSVTSGNDHATRLGNHDTAIATINDLNLQVVLSSDNSVKVKNANNNIGVTGILDVPNGGTGLNTLPQYDLMYGNGTGVVQFIAHDTADTNGVKFLVNNPSAAPSYKTLGINYTAGTTAGATYNIQIGGNDTGANFSLPEATVGQSGVVTTAEQTFMGKKIFSSKVAINGSTTIAALLTASSGIDVNNSTIQNISGMTYSDAKEFYFVDKNDNVIAYIGDNGMNSINFISKKNDGTIIYDMNAEFDAINNRVETNRTDLNAAIEQEVNNRKAAVENEAKLRTEADNNIYDILGETTKNTTYGNHVTQLNTIYEILGESAYNAEKKSHIFRLDNIESNITTIKNSSLQVTLGTNDAVLIQEVNNNIGVTGILPVKHGGTGLETLSQYDLMYGNGTGNVQFIAHDTSDTKGVKFLVNNPNGAPSYKTLGVSHTPGTIAGSSYKILIDGNETGASFILFEANPNQSGVVTTADQSFAGHKTFTGNLLVSGTTTLTGKLTTQSGIDVSNQIIDNVAGMTYSDAERYYFIDKSGNAVAYVDSAGVSAINFISKNSDGTVKYDMNEEFTSLDNRIDTNYNTLDAAIKQEVADRDAAVKAEAKTRSDADTNIYSILGETTLSTDHKTRLDNLVALLGEATLDSTNGTHKKQLENLRTADATINNTQLYVALGSADKTKTFSGGVIGVDGTLAVTNGGTGTATAPTQWGIIYAKSTSAYASTGAGDAGQVLMSNGTKAPSWHTPTSTNTASAIVQRDSSGNFSAGTITLAGHTPAIQLTATGGLSYLQAPADNGIAFCVADSVALASSALVISSAAAYPGKTNLFTLGTSSYKWANVYATTFTGNLSGNADTASAFSSARTIKLTGDVTGEASSTGASGWEIETAVENNSHTHTWSNISDRTTCTISTSGTITGSAVYGAVWNDYAEYRMQIETVEPGYCVVSNNNGQVSKTTRKYQACDGIVSDTFGFAIGETDKCKTPLAVAGRVLAYCEGDKYNYQAGDTVCAGPDGKVCKMTREEIQLWPDRIIGIVSEIPEYETWGTGNVKVNGRIWIKIK